MIHINPKGWLEDIVLLVLIGLVLIGGWWVWCLAVNFVLGRVAG